MRHAQPRVRMPARAQPPKIREECEAMGCRNEPAKSSSTGAFYYFCHHHACQAGPNNCGDQTIKGEKFCEKHAECTDPDCHVRFEPYNLRYSQIGGDRWFCPNHACTEEGCYKRRRDSVTLFCAAHAKENQCSKPGCEEMRVPDGQLCKQHTCDEPGCLLEVYPQGQNGQMCSQHQPCGYAGCRRFTPLDGNGHPEKLCAYHHLCRAPGDPCDGIVDGNSDYCPQHKCGVMGCDRCRDNRRVPENRWCTPHTCITEGCQQCIDNTNDPNSRHCSMHTCSWRGCSGEARMNSRFCSDHVCRRRGCEHSRLEGSHFCPSHSCRHRGCPNAARRQGGCCVEHGGRRDEFSGSDSDSSHRRRRNRHDQPRRDGHHQGPRRVSPGHRRPRRQEEEEYEDDGYYTLSGRNSRNVSPGPRWAPRRDGFDPHAPRWEFQANVPRVFRDAREAEEMERAFQQMDRHVQDRNRRWF